VFVLLMMPGRASMFADARFGNIDTTHENEVYTIIIVCLITVIWLSGKSTLIFLCNLCECWGSIFAHACIF
jgi:hypothetical protein